LAKRFHRRFLEIDQSETRIACGGHVCEWIGTKSAIVIEDLPQMLPYKFWFIWAIGFRREEFKKISQSETRIACACNVFQRIGTKLAIFTEDLT
jgi:hypothetical protein